MNETAVQANITGYWHRHAGAYDTHPLSQLHMDGARAAWADVWRAALPPAPADLLDVGTGTGQVALVLAELGHRVTGIDLAEGMLALARDKSVGMANPPNLQVGDAVTPPFEPATFDAVTCRYLLWTLREPSVALARWRALLRPGGRLAAVDSTWFPGGVRQRIEERSHNPHDDGFLEHYDDDVLAALPLAGAETMEAAAALVEAAGFVEVRMQPLPEIERLERELDEEASGPIRLQYLITGRAPSSS